MFIGTNDRNTHLDQTVLAQSFQANIWFFHQCVYGASKIFQVVSYNLRPVATKRTGCTALGQNRDFRSQSNKISFNVKMATERYLMAKRRISPKESLHYASTPTLFYEDKSASKTLPQSDRNLLHSGMDLWILRNIYINFAMTLKQWLVWVLVNYSIFCVSRYKMSKAFYMNCWFLIVQHCTSSYEILLWFKSQQGKLWKLGKTSLIYRMIP